MGKMAMSRKKIDMHQSSLCLKQTSTLHPPYIEEIFYIQPQNKMAMPLKQTHTLHPPHIEDVFYIQPQNKMAMPNRLMGDLLRSNLTGYPQ